MHLVFQPSNGQRRYQRALLHARQWVEETAEEIEDAIEARDA